MGLQEQEVDRMRDCDHELFKVLLQSPDLTENSTRYFSTATAEKGFVRDAKEKLRYIGADYDTVLKSTSRIDQENIIRISQSFS